MTETGREDDPKPVTEARTKRDYVEELEIQEDTGARHERGGGTVIGVLFQGY